jgi:Zn-finger nucleic acid-binding protein
VDIDLEGWARAEVQGPRADLHCPDGHGPLEAIRLSHPSTTSLDRCPTCLGLFLEHGTLQQLLREAVGPVWEVDTPLLNSLVESPRSQPGALRYRACPACGDMMNRSLFGKRSGVIVDRCRSHGTWLDPGELRQLLAWTRAGGALRHEEQSEQERLRQERREARDAQELQRKLEGLVALESGSPQSSLLETDLLVLLGQALRRLWR